MFYKETEFQDSPIGKIPKEWEVSKMGDVAQVKGRIGWRGLKASEYTTEGPYLIANKHLVNNKIAWDKCDHLSEFRYSESPEIQLQIDDVIISKDGTIGQPAFIDSLPGRATINSTMMLLRVNNDVVAPEFLFYFLQGPHFRRLLKQKISGTSIPHLFQRDMKGLSIFIPSLVEQRAVVRVLGVVDSAIELADKVIAKTERLKKGLMQKLLTEGIGHIEYKNTSIGKTPKTWQVVRIGDIAETSSGGTPSRSKKEYFDGEIPWVKSGELKDNTLYATEETISNEGLQNSAAKIFPKGTLLIALYGATVGKTAILGIDATTNQAVCAILPKGDAINPGFLKYYIIFRREQLIAVSAGGAQPNISQEIIRFTNIPLPQPQEQRKIAEILSTLDKKLEIERAEMTKLENTKHGLMDLLLTGKIRVRMD
jgi:type I restriction enzyme S subunit